MVFVFVFFDKLKEISIHVNKFHKEVVMPCLKNMNVAPPAVPVDFDVHACIALDSAGHPSVFCSQDVQSTMVSIVAGDFHKYYLFKENKSFPGQVFVDGVQVFCFTRLTRDARIEIAHGGQRWYFEFTLTANQHKKPESLYCNYCWRPFQADEDVVVIDGDEYHPDPCGKIAADHFTHSEALLP
jgi:hypothetical protein